MWDVAMKLLKKTKKYLHVRLSLEELTLLEEAIKRAAAEKKEEQKRVEYAEWFFTNHIDISYQDEYSSWHTDWLNVETKKRVQAPDIFVKMYQHRFKDIMDKNRKKLGYKE